MVVTVLGSQWGDEGKGKIVDYLASNADVVIRFNGGNNAGHSIEFDGKKYALHMLPAGTLHPGKLSIIGCGCIVNLPALIEEMKQLDGKPNLIIDQRAHLILPYHLELDGIEESVRQKDGTFVGTTKKGIGPCYADKAARFGIRAEDLLDKAKLKVKIHKIHDIKTRTMKLIYGKEFSRTEEDVYNELCKAADVLGPMVGDGIEAANNALRDGKKILLEGAQGALLSLDVGTYPYVSSSNPTSSGASAGSGIAPTKLKAVVGVVKAYASRVAPGPFPTEMEASVAEPLREKGHEYGATTGRARRLGWLDLVSLKFSSEVNGFTGLAVTRVDTLEGVPELKVGVGYTLDGKSISLPPTSDEEFTRCVPVYKTFKGWAPLPTATWQAMKKFSDLPVEAQTYLNFISSSLGVPISHVGIGPRREDVIVIKDVFAK